MKSYRRLNMKLILAAGCMVVLGGFQLIGSAEPTLADLEGFWEGTAEGESLLDPIKVTLDLWIEDGQLVGYTGHEFAVSKLKSATFTDGVLDVTWEGALIGEGNFKGPIGEEMTLKYEWLVADTTGTGMLKKADPGSRGRRSAAQVAGSYKGTASGAALGGQEVELTLDLQAEGDKLTGKVTTPLGEFSIVESSIRLDRVFLRCEGADGATGLIVGTATGDGLNIFWELDAAVGMANLSRQ